MIQQFPRFSKLSVENKEEIVAFTAKYDPYSDFNFTSLYCWDIDNSTELAMLNGNLVVKMADYITGIPVYSILGKDRIEESLGKLFALTKSIKFVPEIVVKNLKDSKQFIVEEDPDQFDYIYLLVSHANLSGGHFKVKRNKINQFMRTYNDQLSLKKINFKEPKAREEIKEVFQRWARTRQKEDADIQRESQAVERLFHNSKHLNLIGVQLLLDGDCVGFSVNEVIGDNYAICHFQKAILDFEHIDVFLTNVVAKDLVHFGCKYINWEQDLGIPGLKSLKQSYNPEFFLKKYTVTKYSD